MRYLALLLLLFGATGECRSTIRVGSKSFTESYILAEIFAEVIESAGEATVERRFGLGQTGITFQAIENGEIDLYPEYTGTIAQALLKDPRLADEASLREALRSHRLLISGTLGFQNTYALAVTRATAEQLSLHSIEDLKRAPTARAGFSHEFIARPDCYPKVKEIYGFAFAKVKGLSHSLAYQALANGQIDVTDIYSTDAQVEKLGLVVLADDKNAFPDYTAVILAREAFVSRFPKTWGALKALEHRLSGTEMTHLNAMAEVQNRSFSEIAHTFLKSSPSAPAAERSWLWTLTLQHLTLVGFSVLASCLLGIPLAIAASRFRLFGQIVLAITGIMQTIPSLALLCFLIPVFGIGMRPALVALFLYGLLPIVRNGYVGLSTIDPKHLEVAKALGLGWFRRLWSIELPLASPSLLAGIKTSVIISVGTATLAAFIGAGGYGVPIVTGLALNDVPTILGGAIPAAVMALVFHVGFEGLDRVLIPKGLRA